MPRINGTTIRESLPVTPRRSITRRGDPAESALANIRFMNERGGSAPARDDARRTSSARSGPRIENGLAPALSGGAREVAGFWTIAVGSAHANATRASALRTNDI